MLASERWRCAATIDTLPDIKMRTRHDFDITKYDEQYSEQESQRRFEKLVRAALNTCPKPLKTMTPKGALAQSKKRYKKPI
jgi:hypothetical protein